MGFVRSCGITLCASISIGFTTTAQAGLSDRGGGLIYDSDRNITWLSNANSSAGSSYDDGFSTTDGLMTWASAVSWASNLSYYDSVRGVTYTDWRLPATLQPDASCATQQGGGAFSAGANCTGSEMGHLFYAELGGTYSGPGRGLGRVRHQRVVTVTTRSVHGADLLRSAGRLAGFRRIHPEKNFIAAGGIRNKDDLLALRQIGIRQAASRQRTTFRRYRARRSFRTLGKKIPQQVGVFSE